MSGICCAGFRQRVALGVLLAVLATGAAVVAVDQAIKVSVVAILATENDNKIDPKVKEIADEVRRVNPRLTGFSLGKASCKSVKIGAKDSFELVDDQVAVVTVEGREADGRVQLKIVPPLLGEITYMTTCGKFLPIVTRYQTKNQQLLILAVRVQPCPGKK